ANGGTLFLDELGELDKNIQVKLLRFLENREISRLGDNDPIKVDVRVICATNRDLKRMIVEGHFREDLLYRLNMFHIHLPTLRDRKPDVPKLAQFLLSRAAKKPLEAVLDLLTPDALTAMLAYDWPGNVRELANAMEYAWIVSGGAPITANHLPHDVRSSLTAAPPVMKLHQPGVFSTPMPMNSAPMPVGGGAADAGGKSLADVEMEYILTIYAKNGGNKQQTATELGISLKTLYNKLHKYEQDRQLRAAG
ncbi:MAG: sigma 54-interacting transcriptional regulator, partial [Gemmataceae bacterium]